MFNRKYIIDSQLEVYLQQVRRKGNFSIEEKYLFEFKKLMSIRDVFDITEEYKIDFLLYISDKYNTAYAVQQAKTAINSFQKFYMARSNNIKKPIGRPPNIEKIEKAKMYKEKGLSIRQIALLLKTHISLIHRWVNYNPSRLAIFKEHRVIHSANEKGV